MDRLIYIAMSGAQQIMNQTAVTTHNLANAPTTGYKAETAAFRAVPVVGPGLPTRAYAVDATAGANMAAGYNLRIGAARTPMRRPGLRQSLSYWPRSPGR